MDPHDLRHTCLTNLAIAGVPINGIKEYAGHASIVETQKYLKFMPQSIELAAKASDRLGQLSRTQLDTEVPPASEQSLRRSLIQGHKRRDRITAIRPCLGGELRHHAYDTETTGNQNALDYALRAKFFEP